MLLQTRRGFLRSTSALASGVVLGALDVVAQPASRRVRPGGLVPPGEWWAGGGPRRAPSIVAIAPAGEPGERLILEGTVYGPDGRTPLEGATVYVYQTDARGLYNREGRFGAPHRLKAWANTDDLGRYQFQTIKPGHYPAHTDPAHIHMTVCRADMPEWWLPEVRFDGDPLLTSADDEMRRADGRFGNVRPLAVVDGVLRCTRDLRL